MGNSDVVYTSGSVTEPFTPDATPPEGGGDEGQRSPCPLIDLRLSQAADSSSQTAPRPAASASGALISLAVGCDPGW